MTPLPHTGGLWTVVSQLSSGLSQNGHSVTILSPSQMPAVCASFVDNVSRVLRRSFGSWLWFFVRIAMTSYLLAFYARSAKLWASVNLVDAQDPLAFLVLQRPARRRGVPIILTLHGYFHHEASMGGIPDDSLWGALLTRIERRAYDAAQQIIVVDSRFRGYLVTNGVNPAKIAVRWNFVDTSVFYPAGRDAHRQAHVEWNIPETRKVVCCARRLEEKCGVEFAIKAVGHLATYRPEVILVIAGTGSMEGRLRHLVSENQLGPWVRFVGVVDHRRMNRFLACCDAVVVPSVTVGAEVEATSLSALESMAMALPVVASDIGGLAEIIQNGVSGILVRERDPQALAFGIERALSAEGSRLGLAARRRVEEHFSLTAGTSETISLYTAAISGMVD